MITHQAAALVCIGNAKRVGSGGQQKFVGALDQPTEKGQAALIATTSDMVTKQMAQDRVTLC